MNDSSRFAFSPQRFLLILLILLAFFLRVWRLDTVPPGWRDDELIDVLVISQKALAGDVQLYYADASGNEGLYHVLNALMYGLFGATAWGMRGLSVILGTLGIPAVYVLGKRLYDENVGLLAAAALSVSFWSLMYSRFALRQIMTPLLAMLAFICFWRALTRTTHHAPRGAIDDLRLTIDDWLGAGFFLGLGFYVYFASRGVPVIVLAFAGAMGVVARPRLRRIWPGLLLMFVTTALVITPLFIVLGQQPSAEARVTEVGVPLNKALEGDFSLVIEYGLNTLGMFHATGDDEWLYNIPFRPLFSPIGALFFWSGVAIAIWQVLTMLYGIWRNYQARSLSLSKATGGLRQVQPSIASVVTIWHKNPSHTPFHHPLSSLFLLFWWGAGILPGFLSVPAASLGHTIVAQPATYILAVLPVWAVRRWVRVSGFKFQVSGAKHPVHSRSVSQSLNLHALPILMALSFILLIAGRDLPDYFTHWPERGMTRFLYRADIGDVADYLKAHPDLTDFGMTGFLAGPWDRLALEVEYGGEGVLRPRWYNPERALITHLGGQPSVSFTGYPINPDIYQSDMMPVPGETAGQYRLTQVQAEREWQTPACFQNGLCLVWADYALGVLELGWEVSRPLDLPFIPLISNPPPPGVYAGPRLFVFAHLVDDAGNFLTGDDGLWVDPVTLHPGDRWLQQHYLAEEEGGAAAVFGLYDPMTGTRILTNAGQDHLRLDLLQD